MNPTTRRRSLVGLGAAAFAVPSSKTCVLFVHETEGTADEK